MGQSLDVVQYPLCIVLQSITAAHDAPTCVPMLGYAVQS